MLFKELFAHIDSTAEEAPVETRRFVKAAYSKVKKQIQAKYSDDEQATEQKISSLELTDRMRSRLNELMLLAPISTLKSDLANIPGIGPKAADELIKSGVTSTKDLKKPTFFNTLNVSAQLFVKKQPERKIPHDLIAEIEAALKSPNYETYFVGSFRRNKPFSRDIDIMLVANEANTLYEYIEFIRKKLKDVWQYALGEDKASFIVKFKNKNLKLDVFRTPEVYKWAMLLYSTGSKEFNIRMRGLAKKKGLILNQRGLYKFSSEKQSIKNDSLKNRLPDNSEKDYFKHLDMEYLSPELR